MKKINLIISLVASFAGFSTFGQGYFQFTSSKSQVWDGFSLAAPQLATTVNVAFLWGPSGDVPLVESILSGTPTNITVYSSTFSPAAAWNDILNDPNFTLAIDNNTSGPAVTRSFSNGAFAYNGGDTFTVTGTTVYTTYTLFMIGWDGAYATPIQAATADAAVGWSPAFQYTSSSLTSVPNSMNGATPPFGVIGMIPEPASLTMAGLGGLSLLLLRRRK